MKDNFQHCVLFCIFSITLIAHVALEKIMQYDLQLFMLPTEPQTYMIIHWTVLLLHSNKMADITLFVRRINQFVFNHHCSLKTLS